MKPSRCEAFIDSASYASLSDADLCERFLLPMLATLRKISGTDMHHEQVMLRITAYEMSAEDLAALREVES